MPSAPHYASLKVGSEPYVNACQAYNGRVLTAFDNFIPANAVVQDTYAENSLPPSWYTKPSDLVTSSCTVDFADPPWDQATIIFSIDQYGSPALARAAFTQYTPESQAELNKINKQFHTNLKVPAANSTTIPGLASTYFQPSSGTSYTLAGNKIVSFNGGTDLPRNQYLAALRTAIPRAVASVQAPNLQAETGSRDFGKHIGASLYENPCTVFTSAAFTQATGLTADPTAVDLVFNAQAVSHPRTVQPKGIADNSCRRRSLDLGQQRSVEVEADIGYFDSPGQASRELILREDQDRQLSGTLLVPGMGPGAYTATYAGVTSLTVVRGPYTLTVTGSTITDGKLADATLGLLKAAVSATAPQLGG